MSSWWPGASPTPFHSIVSWHVITQAKLLCLFFWTDASLTRIIGRWSWLQSRNWIESYSYIQDPKNSFLSVILSPIVYNSYLDPHYCEWRVIYEDVLLSVAVGWGLVVHCARCDMFFSLSHNLAALWKLVMWLWQLVTQWCTWWVGFAMIMSGGIW